MHVSRSRRRQLFRGDSFSALGRDSCVCQWLFLQFKAKETELHPQYQNGFFVQVLGPVSPSSSRAPYQDCRLLSPPYTNKQDPRPFMKTHGHSAMSLIYVWGDKARPISQISLTIVLMVPIWTLSNPLQCLTSLTKSGGGVGVGWEMGFLDWYLSTTYASNGLENWLSLICNNIKHSL